MTPSEWAEIVDEVKSLWGTSGKWARTDGIFKYAKSIPAGAARSAVASLFQEGKGQAPSPSEVLAVARAMTVHTATVDEIAVYCKHNGHLWAIVDEQGETRTLICARCRTETTMMATLVPTASELEAAADLQTEQIAP